MQLRRHRNDLWFVVVMLVFTMAWGVIGWFWGFQPVFTNFGGIGPDSDVERIHARFPGFLVDPASVGAEDADIVMTWWMAEINTRLALVAGSWLLVAAVLWVLARRSRRSEVRRITTWTPR